MAGWLSARSVPMSMGGIEAWRKSSSGLLPDRKIGKQKCAPLSTAGQLKLLNVGRHGQSVRMPVRKRHGKAMPKKGSRNL